MELPVRRLRTLLLAALAAAGIALAAWEAGQQAQQRALREQAEQSRRQLGLYADALQALIEHYRALPALDPELRAALQGSPDAARQQQLSLKLEQVNGAATSSTLTLLDRYGHAVAASNWRRPDSNVGHDYSFRPYFRQLASGDDGRFFGVGVTTGVPGYFLSKAVRDGQGRLLGALVVKLELLGLEQEWSRGPDLVLASDSHGVIFLASRREGLFRYRSLRPLSPAQRAELAGAQQYPQ